MPTARFTLDVVGGASAYLRVRSPAVPGKQKLVLQTMTIDSNLGQIQSFDATTFVIPELVVALFTNQNGATYTNDRNIIVRQVQQMGPVFATTDIVACRMQPPVFNNFKDVSIKTGFDVLAFGVGACADCTASITIDYKIVNMSEAEAALLEFNA